MSGEADELEVKSRWFRIPSFFMLNWISLNDLLNNKLVKSSSLWLVVTPIFARLFSKVNSFSPPFLDGVLILSLPFSWVCFFFAALFFSIASILFGMYCPRSIRNYKNLNDFKEKDFSSARIKGLFAEDTPSSHPTFKGPKEIFDFFFASWADESGVGLNKVMTEAKGDIFDINMIVENNMQNSFIGLRSVFKDTHYLARLIITLSFYLGFALLSLVLVQNIQFVISQSGMSASLAEFKQGLVGLWPLCIRV